MVSTTHVCISLTYVLIKNYVVINAFFRQVFFSLLEYNSSNFELGVFFTFWTVFWGLLVFFLFFFKPRTIMLIYYKYLCIITNCYILIQSSLSLGLSIINFSIEQYSLAKYVISPKKTLRWKKAKFQSPPPKKKSTYQSSEIYIVAKSGIF
jgi:hypothetical protein